MGLFIKHAPDQIFKFARQIHHSITPFGNQQRRFHEKPAAGCPLESLPLQLQHAADRPRKTLLLKRFGSVRRIAAATEAEIAAVGGIGDALARVIKAAALRASPGAS